MSSLYSVSAAGLVTNAVPLAQKGQDEYSRRHEATHCSTHNERGCMQLIVDDGPYQERNQDKE